MKRQHYSLRMGVCTAAKRLYRRKAAVQTPIPQVGKTHSFENPASRFPIFWIVSPATVPLQHTVANVWSGSRWPHLTPPSCTTIWSSQTTRETGAYKLRCAIAHWRHDFLRFEDRHLLCQECCISYISGFPSATVLPVNIWHCIHATFLFAAAFWTARFSRFLTKQPDPPAWHRFIP